MRSRKNKAAVPAPLRESTAGRRTLLWCVSLSIALFVVAFAGAALACGTKVSLSGNVVPLPVPENDNQDPTAPEPGAAVAQALAVSTDTPPQPVSELAWAIGTGVGSASIPSALAPQIRVALANDCFPHDFRDSLDPIAQHPALKHYWLEADGQLGAYGVIATSWPFRGEGERFTRVDVMAAICVPTTFRGRRLSRQLVSHMIGGYCSTEHARELWVDVDETNVVALTLYATVGFVERYRTTKNGVPVIAQSYTCTDER